jgi:putative DNA primase/helicase
MKYLISVGSSRFSKKWRNKELSWEEICNLFEKNFRITNETQREYSRMSKSEQLNVKDVGGFVGGFLEGGIRQKGNVKHKRIICLDIDNCPTDFKIQNILDTLEILDYNYMLHSTHKHTLLAPRVRIIIPLSREVSNVEYEFIGREIANLIGIDMVDCTGYQYERLMFFGSCPKDVSPVINYITGAGELEVEEYISSTRIKDRETWAYGKDEVSNTHIPEGIQEDPLKKTGIIGAFCRRYPISRVLDEIFEGEYYMLNEGRYTLLGGSTSGGVKVYQDKFYFSYHSSDEYNNRLLNSYDLVLNRKFKGDSKKCISWMNKLAEVREELNKEEFGDEYREWMKKLDRNKFGNCRNSYANLELVVTNCYSIKYNQFSKGFDISGKDMEDENFIKIHRDLETNFGIEVGKEKLWDTLLISSKKFHPIKTYLEGLKWDGKERLDTLLPFCFNVPSTPYTAAVTRKFFCACVKRIYNPGCKFDNVLTLVGEEYLGKSLFGRIMALEKWFTDDLKLTDMRDKTGEEKLNGNWIIELSELAGKSRADEESVTSFISRQDGCYRPPFARLVKKYPRSCCFIATTNKNEGFLTKETGNRRWWVIDLSQGSTLDADKLESVRDQIWAEAKSKYKDEKLYMSAELRRQARNIQSRYLEEIEDSSLIKTYLEAKVPSDFNSMSIYLRREYIQGHMGFQFKDNFEGELVERSSVCLFEIFYELYKREIKDIRKKDLNNLAKTLKKLGWEPTCRRSSVLAYGKSRLYEKKW